MKNAFYILLISLLTPFVALADAWDGLLVDYQSLQSKDTLVTSRTYGQWWFGAFAGWNAKRYFGDLTVPENAYYGKNPFTKLITAQNGFGSGLFTGVSVDYVDSSDVWTYGLKVGGFDRAAWSAWTPVSRDTFQTQFENQTIFDCIAVSPNIRYRLGSSDFFATGGLDFEFSANSVSKNRKKFVNTGKIDQFNKINLESAPLRIGLNLGFAYDFFVADINRRSRVKLSPFANIQMGSPYVSQYGSSWNSLAFKVGLTVKFSMDRLRYDTLIYDPNSITPSPAYNALAQAESRVAYPGFYAPVTFDAMELAVVDYSRINEEVSITSALESNDTDSNSIAVAVDNKSISKELKPEKSQASKKFNPPLRVPKQINNFKSSADAQLTTLDKAYLDELAEYIKTHPGYEVRLSAHSDDRGGSLTANMSNSIKRGEAVRRYLIKQGAPMGSVLLKSNGSAYPIDLNTTEEGRRRNRRVEILVVRLKPKS
ncbi:MAG: OmpA family protein [Chloroflexota bacterium]